MYYRRQLTTWAQNALFFLALLVCTQQNRHARLIEEVRAHSCAGGHQSALSCAVRGAYICTLLISRTLYFYELWLSRISSFGLSESVFCSHDTEGALALQSRCPHCICATVFKHRALELDGTNSLTVASSAKKNQGDLALGLFVLEILCLTSKQTTKDFTVLVLNQPAPQQRTIAGRCRL